MSWPIPGALAFVTPRYGLEVLGGAEFAARNIAERLAASGLEVEVLTTCAVDNYTWDNHYPEGEESINGVKVRRFPIQKGKGVDHYRIGDRIALGLSISLEDEEVWINDRFRSAELFEYLSDEHGRYHTIAMLPYMFWTTYACSQIAPSKNLLIPCLHDEPFTRLKIYQPVFRTARAVSFNSHPEAELARAIFELPEKWEVLGLGVDVPQSPDGDRFRSKFGIEHPYLLYSGRREWGKNVDELIEMFGRYVGNGGEDLILVLTGKGEVKIPAGLRDRVVDLGFVSYEDKADAFQAALAVCQPSQWESFSHLLMEGWIVGTPVIGFGGSAVTADHIQRSGGGLVFNDEIEFQVAVDLMTKHEGMRSNMGEAGRRYVLENYTWEKVIERFADRISIWAMDETKVPVS
jgi:glycosyltransferase involved in cell wall biosynthesis